MSVVLILVSVVIFGTAAGFVGARKGRTSLGIGLGIVLGLIGLIIIACIPAKRA